VALPAWATLRPSEPLHENKAADNSAGHKVWWQD